MEKKLYAAYGSNLNIEQMKVRCPGARRVGAGQLADYRLLFRAGGQGVYLTVAPGPGSYAPVGLWEIEPCHETALDEYEDWPALYRKETLPVAFTEFETGRPRRETALVYIMQAGHILAQPDSAYLRACMEGFAAFGLDTAVLERAAEDWACVG